MISAEEFGALVATYDKHGWQLRRVVVRDLSDVSAVISKEAEVKKGVIDAAWFSRPPKTGANAWEIRFLGPAQYALVEHVDENSDDFEDRLHQTEERLADAVAKKTTA